MKTRAALAAAPTLALTLPAAALAGDTLRVMSWNTRHEGWSGETDYAADAAQLWNNFGSSATSPSGCDLIFLQEVMYATVPPALVTQLNAISGVTWSYAIVGPVGRSTYKEYYAVLYRTDRVNLVTSYLWNDAGDKFEREPQVAIVRDRVTGADYTFINWHTVFGTTTDRQAELAAIASVYQAVQSSDLTDQDVILIGDNNAATDASVSWWAAMRAITPAPFPVFNDLTSLNSNGAYASAYDHVWIQPSYTTEYAASGRDYVADPLSFYRLSDHAPIWLTLYSTSDGD